MAKAVKRSTWLQKLVPEMNVMFNRREARDRETTHLTLAESQKNVAAIVREIAGSGDIDDCLHAIDMLLIHDKEFTAKTPEQRASFDQMLKNFADARNNLLMMRERPDEYARADAGVIDRRRIAGGLPKDGMHDALKSYSGQLTSRQSPDLSNEENDLLAASKDLAKSATRLYTDIQREVLHMEKRQNEATEALRAQELDATRETAYEKLIIEKTLSITNQLENDIKNATNSVSKANSDLKALEKKKPTLGIGMKKWNMQIAQLQDVLKTANKNLNVLKLLKQDPAKLREKVMQSVNLEAEKRPGMVEEHRRVLEERAILEEQKSRQTEEARKKAMQKRAAQIKETLKKKGRNNDGPAGRNGRELPPPQ